jgi:hypothetical protein
MSREVEIIIVHDSYDERGELFVQWLIGWAQLEYKVAVSKLSPGVVELSIAGEDVFKIFARLYRRAEAVRRRLGANVAAAVCEGDECIDMSEMSWPMIIVRDENVKRLEEVVNMFKGLVVRERVDSVSVEDRGGFIRLSTPCCDVDLQIDEAVLLARRLIRELYSLTKLLAFLKADSQISTVFEPLDVTYLPDVDIRHAKDDIYVVSVEWCSGIYLTVDEILRIAYKILDIAASRLKLWKERGRELVEA